MVDQSRVDPYESSTFFADGRGMRTPPPGTIAREDDLEAEHQTDLAKPITRDLLLRGKSRFEVTCAACHGLLGDGDSIVASNMALRRPPSLHLRRDRSDRYFYDVISEGYGLMPSYAGTLSPRDRWAVVAYVRALQLSQAAELASIPADRRDALDREVSR
jgi:mono/diheme cytochrome c family protein